MHNNNKSNHADIQGWLLNPKEINNPLLLIDWVVALDEKRQQEQEDRQNRSRSSWFFKRRREFVAADKSDSDSPIAAAAPSSSSSFSLLTVPLEQGRLHGSAGRAQFQQALEYLLSLQQTNLPRSTSATAATATAPTPSKVAVPSFTTIPNNSTNRAKSSSSTTTTSAINNIKNAATTPIIVSGLLKILQEQQQQQLENEESPIGAASSATAAQSVASGQQNHPNETFTTAADAADADAAATTSVVSTTELISYAERQRRAALSRIRYRRTFQVRLLTGRVVLIVMIWLVVTIQAVQRRCHWMQTWQMVHDDVIPVSLLPEQRQRQQQHHNNGSRNSSQMTYSCPEMPVLYQMPCRFMEARVWLTYRNSPISRLLSLHPAGDDDDNESALLHQQVDASAAFALSTTWTRPPLIRNSELRLKSAGANNGDIIDDENASDSALYSFISEHLHQLQNATTTSRSSSRSMEILDVGCGIGAWLYHYLATTTSSTSRNAKAPTSSSWSYHGIAASHAKVNLARRLWKYKDWRGNLSSPSATPPAQVSFEQLQFQLPVPFPHNRYSLILALGDERLPISTELLPHLVAALRRRVKNEVKNNNDSNNATASRLVLVQEYLVQPRRTTTTTMATTTSAQQEKQLFTYSQWKVAIRETGCHVDFVEDLTYRFELKGQQGRPSFSLSSSQWTTQSMDGFILSKFMKASLSLPMRLLSSLWELWVSACTVFYVILTGSAPAHRWGQLYFYDQGMVEQHLQQQLQRYQRRDFSSSTPSEPVTSHFILVCHV
jgi:hypothetical protein